MEQFFNTLNNKIATHEEEKECGRWSLAYYNKIGVLDLVAEKKTEYVDIAVDIATN